MDSLIYPTQYRANVDDVALEITTISGHNVSKTTTTSLGSQRLSPASRTATGSGMAAHDDLEYHVTFPAPIMPSAPASDGGLTDCADCIYIENETKEPIVVLLGWYACDDRHLSKYSKLYEDMGCITMRFIPRPDLFLYQPNNMRAIASKLVELVGDFNLEEHPIIIHIFSNGGCYVYRHICELIHVTTGGSGEIAAAGNTKLHIRGCVFDSGPAINSPINYFRAIRDTTRGNVLYRWIRGLFLMLVVVVAFIIEYLLGLIWSERGRSAPLAMWTCLSKDPLRCPQLFFYSRADIICGHKSIKSFIEERRKYGVPVSEVCWDDSPHVKHLLFHRSEYTEHVIDFVHTCLRNSGDQKAGHQAAPASNGCYVDDVVINVSSYNATTVVHKSEKHQ